MDRLSRHNVHVSGRGKQFMMFAHGFGCDQNMWRFVAPAFEDSHRVVLFDHVGCGQSDTSGYDASRHSSLQGYADDVVAIARALGVTNGIFVGHSVSAMIGILAARAAPELFSRLVLIGPSPCYINDGDYRGGFERADIEELMTFMDSNFLGWSAALTPQIMGNPDRPELAEELNNSFCRTDPDIAKEFARVTFLSDNRQDLEGVTLPSLILQCSDDLIAPEGVGDYVHAQLPGSKLVKLQATGHCPNLSAPQETVDAIRAWI
ncbi:alpha/beta hydrolase [Sphingomonas sp. LY54]|uniref:alpha/beta fold hydrolase n=1 Tax=Sphingomonas sp. LY54 TaxID=3095343 RepID=UPI002D78B424|nr:alpha/beta hydrolase [Sphingomonas sp. LY54]WRP27622.1 alpha/beta hydrolase [Sphingomonas sp. LY54]